MTRRRWVAVLGLLLAGLAGLGCVLSWLAATTPVVVAPVLEGEPSTVSVRYYAPMLMLSLLLATAAGVLAVLAVADLCRSSPDSAAANPGQLPPAAEHSS